MLTLTRLRLIALTSLLCSVTSLTLFGLVFLSSCHAPITVTTPAGQRAYTADMVVIRINELQNAAIAANAATTAQGQKGLSDATTRLIVTYCSQVALPTLKATPAGWQVSLAASWSALKRQIPPADLSNPLIAAGVSGVDLVLAASGS